jgi:hypothetical protein
MALSGGRNSARARIAAVSVELLFGRRDSRSFLRPGNVSFVFNGDIVMPLFLWFAETERSLYRCANLTEKGDAQRHRPTIRARRTTANRA